MHVAEAPATREELGAALSAAAEAGTPLRFRGGGTKLRWTRPAPAQALELSTTGLNAIVEHNAGDLTAVLEPGVLLADAQATFPRWPMLALEPPTARHRGGCGSTAYTAASGPTEAPDWCCACRGALRFRSPGGGKVIRTWPYDIANLFAGSFGRSGIVPSCPCGCIRAARYHHGHGRPRPRRLAPALRRSPSPRSSSTGWTCAVSRGSERCSRASPRLAA